jgi:hypothetical protein
VAPAVRTVSVPSIVGSVSIPSTVGAALAVASTLRAVAVVSTVGAALAVASMRAVAVPVSLTLVTVRVAGPRALRLAGLSGRDVVAVAVWRPVRVRMSRRDVVAALAAPPGRLLLLVLIPLLSRRNLVPMSPCKAMRLVLFILGQAWRDPVLEVSERQSVVG